MDSDADLIKKVSDANADGFRLEIHAIGKFNRSNGQDPLWSLNGYSIP